MANNRFGDFRTPGSHPRVRSSTTRRALIARCRTATIYPDFADRSLGRTGAVRSVGRKTRSNRRRLADLSDHLAPRGIRNVSRWLHTRTAPGRYTGRGPSPPRRDADGRARPGASLRHRARAPAGAGKPTASAHASLARPLSSRISSLEGCFKDELGGGAESAPFGGRNLRRHRSGDRLARHCTQPLDISAPSGHAFFFHMLRLRTVQHGRANQGIVGST